MILLVLLTLTTFFNPQHIIDCTLPMNSEEFELVTTDGIELYGQSWTPEGVPKAVICLIHGLSEHSGRYHAFAQYFTEKNMAVYAIDLRGHGKTPGKRGHIPNYELLLDDVEELLKVARRTYNDTPLFVYGQSFGGNIVSNYVTKKNTSEVAGTILSAPWLRLAFTPPQIKIKLAGLMQNIYPGYTENSDINPEELSKDPAVIKAYKEDSLVHNRISSRLFFSATNHGELAIANAFKLTIPLLAIHGKEDKLTSWKATEGFVKNTEGKGSLNLYDGVKHEPHNDIERLTILAEVYQWISKQLT